MKYEKVKTQLKALEQSFRDELMPRLKNAAKGKDSLLFCTSGLNQFPQVRPPAESDQLFESAKKIIKMRNDLVMPPDAGCQLASRYLDCCEEYNDIKNHNRRGPLKLAAYLLQVTYATK